MGAEEDPYGECDKKQSENMDSEGNKVIIKIDNKPNIYLAAQRLQQFLMQFGGMSEEQKQACIERVDEKAPGMLAGLYDALNEYME